jgi:hypothetical protein
MPHHVRQTVHHNINQDTGTENIERPRRSAGDPEVKAALDSGGDNKDDHRGGKGGRKPPRGLPDEYNEAA